MKNDSYPIQPDTGTPFTRGPIAGLLWGVFLGCSWTWIIGMVFPALLLRDYGLYGWFVFAIPNVLGAAAMGLVLYRPQWSVNIVTNHRVACQNFTVITVAFHLFVVAWLFSKLFGLAAVPMLVVAVGLCAMLGLRNRNTAMLFVAVAVAVVSWGCFSWATQAPGAWSLAQWAWPTVENRLTKTDLLWFAPAALFGFALCPYLDLTFHRARINTSPGTGVLAFFFGFGIVFCSMIVFSICYGAQLLPFIHGDPDAKLNGLWLVLLAVHLTLQAGFTVTVHVREAMEDKQANIPWLVAAGGLAILLGLAARLEGLPDFPRLLADLTWGEAGYRVFLLFYGTVLPGYVWLIMIPRLRGPLSPRGVDIRMFIYAVVCGLSLAFAWVGFAMGDSRTMPYLFAVFIVGRVAVELLPKAVDA
ncbi:MAG: hypothetical protein AB8C95_13255 [Phycisphaeraceae bacterium]